MKYAVLLLALMFAGCGGGDGSSTVGYEIKLDGKTIQVAEEDFPNAMSWYDAMRAFEKLGNGWRLPSIEELDAMYNQLHTTGKGNFRNETWYWSSYEDEPRRAYFMDFTDESITSWTKGSRLQVRAVRDLP